MKHRFFCGILAVVLCFAGVESACAEVLTPELIRLQVVAESDDPEAQRLKLAVRDGVLEAAQALLSEADSADEAWQLALANPVAFEDAARQVVEDSGQLCEIRVELGEFDFPDRIYGGVLVPAGQYRALRVTLGEGKGHNWWCVLYPTLCRIDESALEDDGTITFYSDTLRLLERLFGGEAA